MISDRIVRCVAMTREMFGGGLRGRDSEHLGFAWSLELRASPPFDPVLVLVDRTVGTWNGGKKILRVLFRGMVSSIDRVDPQSRARSIVRGCSRCPDLAPTLHREV